MEPTDAELLIASRRDPAAFREIYDRWAERLQLATNSVACFDRAKIETGASVLPIGEESPIDVCARILGTDELSACVYERSVAVFPARDACERLGLAPLPAGYAPARERFNALARAITALERDVDCLQPDEFEDRVQALLERHGWTGWRTWRRSDLDEGPCGAISAPGGDGRRWIEGAVIAGVYPAGDGRGVVVAIKG